MPKKPYSAPTLASPMPMSDVEINRGLLKVTVDQVGDFVPGKIFYDREADMLRRLPLILG